MKLPICLILKNFNNLFSKFNLQMKGQFAETFLIIIFRPDGTYRNFH
jgi:hypothetical protein